MWWRAKDEWLARRGPSEKHAQCTESAKVLMAAAGTGCEALLVGESGDGLLAYVLNSSNVQQLAVLLSDRALVKAVLTAQCSYARSALHYAVELCDDSRLEANHSPAGLRACMIRVAHDAGCLHDVLSVRSAAGVTAAARLLRIGCSDFVALLPADSPLKVRLNLLAILLHALCMLLCTSNSAQRAVSM
jgi:hypothetical protein